MNTADHRAPDIHQDEIFFREPVLRQDDFTRFDLDRAKRSVISLAELVRNPQRA